MKQPTPQFPSIWNLEPKFTDKELLKELKKKLLKGYGKPCKEFRYGCPVCDVWMAYQILEDAFNASA